MATHKERLDAQLEEEARLESLIYGSEKEELVLEGDEAFTPEESSIDLGDLTDDPRYKEIVPEDTGEVESLRKELADSVHRYNRFKGSADRTIRDLRLEVSGLTNRVSDSIREIGSLKTQLETATPQKELFNDDVKDVFGEEATDSIKAVIEGQQKQLKEMQAKLDSQEADRLSTRAATITANNTDDFIKGLTRLVPDQAVMNKDPKFNEWLRSAGDDGVERLDRLRADVSAFDYHRAAEFFLEYKISLGSSDTRKIVEDSIASHIGPKGTRTSESDTYKDKANEGIMYQSEINEYNRKVSKGAYKYDSKGAEVMEARIFKAMNAGKILLDEKPNN